MIRELMLPTHFFKFCKLDANFYSMVQNKQFFFKNPSEFNDPFDCNVCWDTDHNSADVRTFVENTMKPNDYSSNKAYKKALNKRIIELRNDPIKINALFNGLKKRVFSLGISCFTATNENFLMWSHYADSHKGVCITFHPRKLLNHFREVFQVQYTDDFPQVNFLRNHNEAVYTILSTKSTHWSYEKEYRIVTPNRGLHSFPIDAFHQICFGLRTPEEDILRTIAMMRDYGYMDHVELWPWWRLKLSDKEYKFEYSECNSAWPSTNNYGLGPITS